MKEGFLIGGAIVIIGLFLELSIGSVVWESFAWPVNGIVLGSFFALTALVYRLREKVHAFQFIGTYQAAVPAMVYATVLTIIMGLTRQQSDGTWFSHMLTFWPFVLIYVYDTLILGVISLKRFRILLRHANISRPRRVRISKPLSMSTNHTRLTDGRYTSMAMILIWVPRVRYRYLNSSVTHGCRWSMPVSL